MFLSLTRDIHIRIFIYIGIPERNVETGGLQIVCYISTQSNFRPQLFCGSAVVAAGSLGFPEVHLKAALAVTVSLSRYFTSASQQFRCASVYS